MKNYHAIVTGGKHKVHLFIQSWSEEMARMSAEKEVELKNLLGNVTGTSITRIRDGSVLHIETSA